MKVSAIIPTFNRKAHICRAIDSVLAQTLPVDEIIVVDDGSTDGTGEAIQDRYGSAVRIVRQRNSGVSAARTRAIREAQGEWIAFLDSDDIWLPGKLQQQFEILAAMGADFGVCVTNCNYTGDNTNHRLTAFEEAGVKTDLAFGPLRDPIQWILGTYSGIYLQSMIVLRSLLEDVNGFDSTLGLAEDRDIVFRLAFKTKFCFISSPLVSIDRTPAVSRLTGLLARKDDRSYVWLEKVREKWLADPQLTDTGTRQVIKNELISLYYGGAVERLKELKLAAAFQQISGVRRLGHGPLRISWTLAGRAANKIKRTRRAPLRENQSART